jgi:hypothetical protein
MNNRDHKSKESLIKYLQKDTDERLWQAIRNWSGYAFIFTAEGSIMGDDTYHNLHDTFYDESDAKLSE